MAYRAQAGNAVISAQGSKVITVSDFDGDTPKFVLIRSTKSTSDGSYQDDALFSFGWGDTNQEDSGGLSSVDNVGDSVVVRSTQDNLLTLWDPAGSQALDGGTSVTLADPAVVNLTGHGYDTGDLVAISGVSPSSTLVEDIHSITKIDNDSFSIPVNNPEARTGGRALKITDQISLTSFTADTVTLSVDIYGGTSYTIEYMALGGSTLTDVYVGSFLIPTAADSKSGTDIAFVDGGGGADTITSISTDLGVFLAGQIIRVSGSVSNDGDYTVVSSTSTVITLATGVLTAESAGASVNVLSGFFLVQGAGFVPDAGMLFSVNNDNGASTPPRIDVNNRESVFSFGFFESGGSQCADSRIYSSDQEATMETYSLVGINDRCFSQKAFKSGGWATRGELTFDSMHASDGFMLRQELSGLPSVSIRVPYVVLKGGNYEVVQKTAPTSVGVQDIVNTGAFTPSGAMFLFGFPGGAASAAMSMGWASNADGTKANTKEGVAFVSDDDGADPSDARRLTRVDKALAIAFATSGADIKAADLHTWNSDGVSLDFTTANATTPLIFHAVMFGDGTVTPAAADRRRVMGQVI